LCEIGEAFGVEGFDDASVVDCAGEDFEVGVFEGFGEVLDFEFEAGVGFVDAVVVHGFVEGHAGEGGGDIDVEDVFPDAFHEAFHEGVHAFAVDEGDFDVDLGELGLAVGPEVFVTEAFGELIVSLYAGDHEHLFVLLGGLGEGVEFAGVDAAGYEEFPCTFGGAFEEHGGFDFEEMVVVEVIASGLGSPVAELENFEVAGSTEV